MISPANTRHIHTGLGSREVMGLLQNLFSTELVSPGESLWLVSPWISNIAVLDNTANTFGSYIGEWACENVRLATVLARLIRHGTIVHVATRPDAHNVEFLKTLRSECHADRERVKVVVADTLHSKGILGDGYYLSGSMNITHNGVTFNDETVHLFTDPEVVAENRNAFQAWWREHGGDF